MDFASLHILLTLDFIGDIAYGTDFQAMAQGSECRILQLLETILPELMKCGFFPLRKNIPILRATRNMYRAIAEMRTIAEKAIKDVRETEASAAPGPGTKHTKIFEILVL